MIRSRPAAMTRESASRWKLSPRLAAAMSGVLSATTATSKGLSDVLVKVLTEVGRPLEAPDPIGQLLLTGPPRTLLNEARDRGRVGALLFCDLQDLLVDRFRHADR